MSTDKDKATGIRAIGIDNNEAYLEIAAKRLAQGVFDFASVSDGLIGGDGGGE